jgi:D-sedoheptulose 7-phosphate isomerase
MTNTILQYLSTLKDVFDKVNTSEIQRVAELFLEARASNKTIYVFGNGGSGSTASHMVCDIIKGCSFGKEKRFRIISLNDNIPTLLAYANDVSFDEVFVEQLKNFLSEGDIVLGISGSGNSINVIKAIEYANNKGNTTIGFTGYDGGKLKQISNFSVNAGINDMQMSEDIHIVTLHILYKILERS